MNKEQYLIIKKTQIKDHCATYDPLGLCPVTDCFTCENADFRILDSNGTIIRDFKFPHLKDKNIRVSKYILEFFEEVNLENIEDYLNDEDSDYRMTRIYSSENGTENTVMRPSKADRKKEIEEQQKIKDEYEERLRIVLGDESYQMLCRAREGRILEEKEEAIKESKIKKLWKKMIKKGE